MSTTALATQDDTKVTDSCKETASCETFARPRFTVKSDEVDHEIQVNLPGVRKKDVTISLEDGVLEVIGRRSVSTPKGWKSIHRELASDDYRLRLQVTTPVEEDAIVAKVSSGVLTLTLPVRPEPAPRTIKVS